MVSQKQEVMLFCSPPHHNYTDFQLFIKNKSTPGVSKLFENDLLITLKYPSFLQMTEKELWRSEW